MPVDRLADKLAADVREMENSGRAEGAETLFARILPPEGGKGPRYLFAGEGKRPYLRINSNSYLGLSRHAAIQGAEEQAVAAFGAGPSAVRFISGTWGPPCGARAAPGALSRPPGGDDLQLRLRHRDGRAAAVPWW